MLATGVVWFLLAAGAPGAELSIETVARTVQDIGVGGGAGIIAAAMALAVTLQPLQYRLVQLLEGYWPTRGWTWAFRLGVWSQQRRRNRLVKALTLRVGEAMPTSVTGRRALEERFQVAEDALRTRFPATERLLPTALGNVLRSAEDRVGVRYGIGSVVLWPRLFRLLPKEVADDISDEVTQMDVSARLAVTWFGSAVAAGAILLAAPAGADAPRQGGWWLVPGLLLALSWLSYRGAIESALAHGSDIEVGIDLYRGRVLDAMRLPEPRRLSEERRQFATLEELFTSHDQADDLDITYRRPT